MFNNRIEIIRGILIGSSIFLCLILLIIAIYLLYRYKQKTIYLRENLNDFNLDEQSKKNNFNFNKMKKSEEEEEEIINPLNNENYIEKTSPKIIGELMRKSLQLAKTAEKVADHNEKRYTLKDNIHLHL